MFKMKVALDIEKIENEGQYSSNAILNALDKLFIDKGFIVIKNRFNREYRGTEAADDYSNMGIILNRLRKWTCFFDNVKEWFLCNNEDTDNEMDFSEENLIDYFRMKKAV